VILAQLSLLPLRPSIRARYNGLEDGPGRRTVQGQNCGKAALPSPRSTIGAGRHGTDHSGLSAHLLSVLGVTTQTDPERMSTFPPREGLRRNWHLQPRLEAAGASSSRSRNLRRVCRHKNHHNVPQLTPTRLTHSWTALHTYVAS
jgi:hypothetical protein